MMRAWKDISAIYIWRGEINQRSGVIMSRCRKQQLQQGCIMTSKTIKSVTSTVLQILLLLSQLMHSIDSLSHFQNLRTLKIKTHREEHKVLLVVFSDTVVDPGTVMIHLFDAAFAHTADTCAIRTDITTTQLESQQTRAQPSRHY